MKTACMRWRRWAFSLSFHQGRAGRENGLANEAFALRASHYLPLHQKHYFSDEGWYDAVWF